MITTKPDHGEEDQPAVRKSREQLQCDCDAADLAGERHQIHDLRRDERAEGGLEPDPLADRVEDRLARRRGHTPAHLRVDDDPEDADRDHPRELIAERRAGGGVEHEVADVDEASDRGEDAERKAEELVHGQPPNLASCRSTVAATSRSDGCVLQAVQRRRDPRGILCLRSYPLLDRRECRPLRESVREVRRLDGELLGLLTREVAVVFPRVVLCARSAPSQAIESRVAASLVSA